MFCNIFTQNEVNVLNGDIFEWGNFDVLWNLFENLSALLVQMVVTK
jgi:hypothetical protein